MTADEIREHAKQFTKPSDGSAIECAALFLLAELAAQIAELNDKLPSFLSNDERFRVDVKGWHE